MVGLVLYLSLLFSSLSIASVEGYTISTHTISELALCICSPVPFLFDFSCIIGGITSVLFYYSLSKKFDGSKKDYTFSRYGMMIGMIGSVGIIFVGIFSLDRVGGMWHGVSSVLAFGGYILSIGAFSIKISRYTTLIPSFFILNGTFPSISLILYFVFLSPLCEWIMLLSIISSLIPLYYWTAFK